MKTHYEQWRKVGLIKPAVPDLDQIAKQLGRASKDLRAAEAICTADRTWAFTIAYHAMIRAGRAFMLSRGYLPTTVNPHRTVVDFTREGLGGKYDDLLRRFNRMRRKRHDFIYDSENATTDQEVRDAIKAAQDLIRGIRGSLADPLPLS